MTGTLFQGKDLCKTQKEYIGTLPLVVIDNESHYNFHVHCSW